MHAEIQKQLFGQKIFDNSPTAIIIYEVQGDGMTSMDYIIRSVNRACLDIEGWTEKTVIDKPLGVIRTAADKFGIVQVFRQVWKTGKKQHYPAKGYDEGGKVRWFDNTVYKLPSGEVVAAYQDVTEKIQAQEELHAEKERLKVTLYSIGDGVIATDNRGRVQVVNQVAEELTGWTQEEAEGQPLATVFKIFNECTGEAGEDPVQKVLRCGQIVGLANHTILKSKKGVSKAIADSAAPIRDQNGQLIGVVLVFRDVTDAREKEAKIEYLSLRDSLTGLHNRAFFEIELDRLGNDPACHPMTLIMGDIDGLKLINDAYGHETGDLVLSRIAKGIRASCRTTDYIARWGGDEFVILLSRTTESAGQKICGRIKETCNQLQVSETALSISLGYAVKTDVQETWQNALKKAEDNMYRSKLLGAKSYRSTVLSSIKNALYERSFETQEHGERLAQFCLGIGRAMGLSEDRLDELQVLAMLHDVGKIAIDGHILRKPSSLSKEEMEIVKKHPEIGYRIAHTVPELSSIADYILAHHERWDGNGYPRGLAGNETPLLARILAVVDAYDAITQDRPYRKARSAQEAKEELLRNAGTQFDPEIVAIFLAYLDDDTDLLSALCPADD